MRVSVTRFFYPGPNSLVGECVLDCYRLANFYHISPTVFLEMPASEVRIHLERTIELSHQMKRERMAQDDG